MVQKVHVFRKKFMSGVAYFDISITVLVKAKRGYHLFFDRCLAVTQYVDITFPAQ